MGSFVLKPQVQMELPQVQMELQVWAIRPVLAHGGALASHFQLLGSPIPHLSSKGRSPVSSAVQTPFVQPNEASVLASSTLNCPCDILGVAVVLGSPRHSVPRLTREAEKNR